MKKRTTKQKITINSIVLMFSDSNQRFKNVIFIKLTIVLKTNFKHMTKRHIKQSFHGALSIDNLIEQLSKSDIQNQNSKFSFNQTIKRQLHKKDRSIHFDQSFRDVKNNLSFKNARLF